MLGTLVWDCTRLTRPIKTVSFVAMYGVEWGTISQGGHVMAYGLPGLIGWESGSGGWGTTNNYDIFCAKGDFASFWPIVKSYPTAFCTLAHPQTNDYGSLIDAAGVYNADTDSVVVGVAIRSGSAMSTTTDYYRSGSQLLMNRNF